MMEALTALHSRVSATRVRAPAPDQATLEQILRAGLRTADHGLLRPWRFLIIQGDSLTRLAELFAHAAKADALQSGEADAASDELAKKASSKALRAPLIVVGITSPKPHPKVPVLEQQLSTGGALQNMLTAAYALNVGAIWRTGPMAEHPIVREGLGLAAQESITGFLYMGTPDGPLRVLREESVGNYVQEW